MAGQLGGLTFLDANDVAHKYFGELVELLAAEVVAAHVQSLGSEQSDLFLELERLHRIGLKRGAKCPATDERLGIRYHFASTAFDGGGAHTSEPNGLGRIAAVEIVVVALEAVKANGAIREVEHSLAEEVSHCALDHSVYGVGCIVCEKSGEKDRVSRLFVDCRSKGNVLIMPRKLLLPVRVKSTLSASVLE